MEITKKPDWTYYQLWIFWTTFCVPFAFVIHFLIVMSVLQAIFGDYVYVNGVRHITEDYLAIYPLFPIVGLLTGVLQYLLLRRHLPRMGWWVWATLGGWIMGELLILVYSRLYSWTYESIDIVLACIGLGLSIGVGQWLLLRRRLSSAGWWIGANIPGWVLSGLIAGKSLVHGDGGVFAMGFFPACVTAAILAWFLNNAQPIEPHGVSKRMEPSGLMPTVGES